MILFVAALGCFLSSPTKRSESENIRLFLLQNKFRSTPAATRSLPLRLTTHWTVPYTAKKTVTPILTSLSETLRLSDSKYEVHNITRKVGKDGSDDDFESRYVFHFISIYVIGALMHIESYPLRSNMIRGYSVLSIIVHVCLQSKYLSISVPLRNVTVTNASGSLRLLVLIT